MNELDFDTNLEILNKLDLQSLIEKRPVSKGMRDAVDNIISRRHYKIFGAADKSIGYKIQDLLLYPIAQRIEKIDTNFGSEIWEYGFIRRIAHDTSDAPDEINLLSIRMPGGGYNSYDGAQPAMDLLAAEQLITIFPTHYRVIEAYRTRTEETISDEDKYAFIRDFSKYTGLDKLPRNSWTPRLILPLKTQPKKITDYTMPLERIEYFGATFDNLDLLMDKSNKFTDHNIKYDSKLDAETRVSIRRYAAHVYDKFVESAVIMHDRYVHGDRDMELTTLLLFPDISDDVRRTIIRGMTSRNHSTSQLIFINAELIRLGKLGINFETVGGFLAYMNNYYDNQSNL
jgi:hypothetical protein